MVFDQTSTDYISCLEGVGLPSVQLFMSMCYVLDGIFIDSMKIKTSLVASGNGAKAVLLWRQSL